LSYYLLQLVAVFAFKAIIHTDIQDFKEDHDFENNNDDDGDDGAGDPKVSLLVKAQRLVGYFNRSTQAIAGLKEIQMRSDTTRPLAVVQDVVTRWWSPLAMVDHLFDLREALLGVYKLRHGFKVLHKKGSGACRMFEDTEWEALDGLRFVLRPLQLAQRVLEGYKKYVTSSLVPFLVYAIHSKLQKMSTEELGGSNMNSSVQAVATVILKKVEEQLGMAISEPFQDTVTRGKINSCQVGLNKAIIYAYALDPRFKTLGT